MLQQYSDIIEVVDQWWAEVGDAKTILSQMATTLEKVAHARTGLEFYGGVTKSAKYTALADGLTMNKVAVCLEIISEWFTQSYTKAQVLLLTARLYKMVNGSTVNIEPASVKEAPVKVAENAPQLVPAGEIRNQLKGF